MKKKLYLQFCCIIILLITWSESSAQIPFTGEFIPPPQLDPTYANIATAENVLVVYREVRNDPSDPDDSISVWIKDYYKTARNIPDENIVGLVLPPWKFYENQTELVILLADNDELIHLNTWGNSPPPDSKDYAWRYVQEYIMDPIQYHLDNTIVNGLPLRETIRYIVLCKGIPLKVNSWVESGSIAQIDSSYGKLMVCVDALICLLSQPNPNFSILTDVFKTSIFSQVNPYYNQDDTYSMDYRFVTDHFIAPNGVQLSYLVSRLDGESYADVIDLIDRSLVPDKSGNSAYVLDATQNGGPGTTVMRGDAIFTDTELQSLGMIDTLNITNDHVIEYPSGNVMAYSSSGVHAGLPLAYPVNTLNFNYSNGAIFNTYESFNGTTMDVDNFPGWGKGQGLISEFINSGGTSGAGHVYEPTTATVSDDGIYFPEYSIGYSAVDAAYLGMWMMAFQNVVVGDPLVTITWGKQTLTENKIWMGTNLVTGKINIPPGKTLTISSNAVINLKHNGALEVEENGTLVIQPGAKLNFYNGSSLIVNGTLNAQGLSNNHIIFDRSGSTNWYGIVINSSSGSSSNITNAEIKNANYGLLINNASPSITNTKINYCGTGIYILSGAAPKFYNNTITYNDYNGVTCIAGVTASFGTFPTWGDNVIRKNGDIGIYAAYSCTIFLGQNTLPPTGGRNSIYENYNTNGYQISIRYGSTSMAEKNWWGSDPPDPSIFNTSGPNDIDYDPWWTGSDPHAGRSLTKSSDNGYNPNTSPVVSGLDNLREKLWKAFIFYQKAEYDSALQIGKAILIDSPSSQEALSVLNVLRLAYSASGKAGFQGYITSLIAQHSGKEVAGVARLNLAYYLAKQRDFVAALAQLKKNVNAFPNSPLERISLFQKAVFFLLELEDRESTEAVLAELERKYPDDPLVVEIQRLLGRSIQEYRPQKQTEPVNTIDFALIANYPNPFNPTTTIEYSIPEASFVELKIYDILGGEVASLVKENKPSGKHSVKFNASNLPSGIYFYRIVSGNFTATKKLILLK